MEIQPISNVEEPEKTEAEICQTEEEIFYKELTYDVFEKILDKFEYYNTQYFLESFEKLQNNKSITEEENRCFQNLLRDVEFKKEIRRWFENIKFYTKGNNKEEFRKKSEDFNSISIDYLLKLTRGKLVKALHKSGIEQGKFKLNSQNIGTAETGDIIYLNENGEVEILSQENFDGSDLEEFENEFVIVTKDDGKRGIYDIDKNWLVGGWKQDFLKKQQYKGNGEELGSLDFIDWFFQEDFQTYLDDIQNPYIYLFQDDRNSLIGRKIITISEDGLQRWLDIDNGKEIGGHPEIVGSPETVGSMVIYKALCEDNKNKAFFDGETGKQITSGFENIRTISPGDEKLHDQEPQIDVYNKFLVYNKGKVAIYDSEADKVISEWCNDIEREVSTNFYSRCLMKKGNTKFFVDTDTGERISQEFNEKKEINVDVVNSIGRFWVIETKDEKIITEFYNLANGERFNIFEEELKSKNFGRKEGTFIKKGYDKIVFGYIERGSILLKIIDWENGNLLYKKRINGPEDYDYNYIKEKFKKIVNIKDGKLYLKKFGGRKEYLED